MRNKIPPSPDLGAFMRSWRDDNNLTSQAAGERAGVSKATWSALENATRTASAATLYGIERATGMAYDDLARLAGHAVKPSADTNERARRVAAMADAMPRMRALVDLLPRLKPEQVDTLVSLAETFTRQKPG